MPPRRSSRITAASQRPAQQNPEAVTTRGVKTRAANLPFSDTDKADNERPRTHHKKPRKRVKTDSTVSSAPAKPTSQRGILQQLTDTPLDVLLEIFSSLEPLDLLHMSRTTKALRSLLMCKSSSSVWERARLRTEGLPPIFHGMSKPAYANLLFDSHCHNCHKAGTKYVQWQIRMRLCRACLDGGTIMATSHALRNDFKDRPVPPPEELLQITPNFMHHQKTVYLQFYDCESYAKLVEEIEALKRGSPVYEAWLSKKKKQYTALARECNQYEKWLESRMAERAAELAAIRNGRLSSVIARLTENGWGEEVGGGNTVRILQEDPLVNQAKELTERDWEIMKPTLIELMERLRADLVQRKMQTFKSDRVKLLQQLGDDLLAKLPETPPNPPASILFTNQLWLDIIEDTPFGAPFDHDVTEQFKEGLKDFPAICAGWREKQAVHLKQLLREADRSEDLSLAVNAFTCAQCSAGSLGREHILHYPYFATHACFFSRTLVACTKVDVWDDKRIKVVAQAGYEAIEKVIRLCGLDPATATAHDMEDVDAYFVCGTCCDINRPRDVMRWRAAMNHQRHLESLVHVTDPQTIALAQRAEKSFVQAYLGTRDTAFVCIHCDVLADSEPSQHLLSVHGISGATEDHYRQSLKNKPPNTATIRLDYS